MLSKGIRLTARVNSAKGEERNRQVGEDDRQGGMVEFGRGDDGESANCEGEVSLGWKEGRWWVNGRRMVGRQGGEGSVMG